jgi:hypothetical protein
MIRAELASILALSSATPVTAGEGFFAGCLTRRTAAFLGEACTPVVCCVTLTPAVSDFFFAIRLGVFISKQRNKDEGRWGAEVGFEVPKLDRKKREEDGK